MIGQAYKSAIFIVSIIGVGCGNSGSERLAVGESGYDLVKHLQALTDEEVADLVGEELVLGNLLVELVNIETERKDISDFYGTAICVPFGLHGADTAIHYVDGDNFRPIYHRFLSSGTRARIVLSSNDTVLVKKLEGAFDDLIIDERREQVFYDFQPTFGANEYTEGLNRLKRILLIERGIKMMAEPQKVNPLGSGEDDASYFIPDSFWTMGSGDESFIYKKLSDGTVRPMQIYDPPASAYAHVNIDDDVAKAFRGHVVPYMYASVRIRITGIDKDAKGVKLQAELLEVLGTKKLSGDVERLAAHMDSVLSAKEFALNGSYDRSIPGWTKNDLVNRVRPEIIESIKSSHTDQARKADAGQASPEEGARIPFVYGLSANQWAGQEQSVRFTIPPIPFDVEQDSLASTAP